MMTADPALYLFHPKRLNLTMPPGDESSPSRQLRQPGCDFREPQPLSPRSAGTGNVGLFYFMRSPPERRARAGPPGFGVTRMFDNGGDRNVKRSHLHKI